ncbi:MAG TPA: DUF559 domain-containing protein [Hyphomicrobiaceae bacterium]
MALTRPKRRSRDETRTRYLAKLGYRVFRVTNDNNLDYALDALLAFIEAPR